nr:hypothetical protein [Bacillus thuringiensis]
MIESSKEEFIRLTELTAHIDGADRLLNESQGDVIELISAEKELITIVNEEVDSNIVPVTLDAQCIIL